MEEREVEKIRINALRERVIRYRWKILEERAVKNVESEEIGKHFFKSTRIRCYLCQDVGHRTSDCDLKFDLVLSRLKAEEKNREKIVDERNIKIVETNRLAYNKRRQNTIIDAHIILKDYEEVFYKENEILRFCKLEKCKIVTKREAKVVKKGVVVPHALNSKLSEHLVNLEKRGVIRKSTSDWRNPIRALQKPNGEIRLVLNFMALNDLCEKDPYELKNIREIINETHGYNYFTVLDLKDAFYSIEIEENHKYKTAFEFSGKLYEWNSMVMGFKNAPQILQRVMTKILEDEIGKGVSVYMDDVIICGKTRCQHDELLRKVLGKFIQNKG
jgi:hypothetical protein